MKTVGELCQHEVVVATPDTSVAAAAKLMRHRHVGSLVIVHRMDGGLQRPVGIVTDRDIVVEVTASDSDADELTVADVMSEPLATVRADSGALETIQLMRSRGVRRMPVVTEDGALIGIVAFDDLLEVFADELQTLSRAFARKHKQGAVFAK